MDERVETQLFAHLGDEATAIQRIVDNLFTVRLHALLLVLFFNCVVASLAVWVSPLDSGQHALLPLRACQRPWWLLLRPSCF